jgi:hypothetical protein
MAANWYEDNLLLANKDTFQVMTVKRNQKTMSNITLKVNNEEIQQNSVLKLLGISIDDKLNFTDHVKTVCIKSSRQVGVLMRLRNLIPEEAKM